MTCGAAGGPLGTAAVLLAAGLPWAACDDPTASHGAYACTQPPQTGDGWQTASAAQVGLDSARLERLMDDLQEIGGHEVHGIVVVRHGRLAFEAYFPGRRFALGRYTGDSGFTRDDTHSLASVTKSVTSTLAGIALDRGALT